MTNPLVAVIQKRLDESAKTKDDATTGMLYRALKRAEAEYFPPVGEVRTAEPDEVLTPEQCRNGAIL